MNIGIFGGTFNPPHIGHINIAEIACKELLLDRLIVIPTKEPPHKEVSDVSEADRFNMAKLAFEKIPQAIISDIELKRVGKSYTADTLAELKKIYAGDELFLIIGSDMYLYFEQWREYKNILNMCKLAVFLRKAEDYDKIRNYCKVIPAILMENVPVEISSTDIREKNLYEFVPSNVYEYIKNHKLYNKD